MGSTYSFYNEKERPCWKHEISTIDPKDENFTRTISLTSIPSAPVRVDDILCLLESEREARRLR